MKIKTRDVVFLYETINAIAETETIKQAPIDIKFLLVRNARIAQPVFSEFMEVRQNLMLENSSPVEDSDQRSATKEQAKFINDEIAKIEQVELELPLSPISLNQLDSLKLDLAQLSALYPIIANEGAY